MYTCKWDKQARVVSSISVHVYTCVYTHCTCTCTCMCMYMYCLHAMLLFYLFPHVQVAKSKITTAGTYVPPKSHPQGSAQPVVSSSPQSVTTIKQQSLSSGQQQSHHTQQQVSTAGIFVPPNASGTYCTCTCIIMYVT